jgi:hypothetical protein
MNKTLIFLLLLSPLPGQDAATALQHAREVNLERAAKLPNFVADETMVRYKSRHTNPPKWQKMDTIESEIAVKGPDVTRQHTLINGKPWKKGYFPGFNWSVQFGTELQPLFGPKCGTTIEFEGPTQERGKQLLAYRFQAPPNGCFGTLTQYRKHYSPVWSGRFLIEDPGGSLVQFEDEAHEFPKGWEADPITQTITWDYVKIGNDSYLLPVGFEVFGGITNGDLWHVVVEFKNHRHFEASSNLTFK